jgi:hypothetical protein
MIQSRWDCGFGRDGENGHRDGRAHRQRPSWWPCAGTGQWQFGVDERGKGRGAEKSQRDFIIQPGVDAQRLRRVVIVK